MKSFIASLLAAGAVATTWEQDTQIVGGVFWGILEKEDLPEIELCAKDADIFSTQILHAFQLIAAGDIKDIEAGIKLIAGSVRVIKGIMDECAQTSEDLATFEDWASIFLHPKILVPTVKSNLKSHLPALTLDLKKARKDLKNEEYFAFGAEIGKMLVILSTPDSVLSTEFWN